MQVEQHDQAALEAEVSEVFSLDDISAPPSASEPPAGGGEPPANEAGEGVAAPSSSPEPQQQEPSEAAPQPAAAEPAPAEPSAAPAAPSAAPEPPPAAPQPQPVDDRALREASLTAQVDALQREVQTLRANPQAGQPASAAESGQPQQQPQLTRYNLTLPPPVQEALLSDDPQKNIAGINAVVNDLGSIVHNAVVQQIRGEVSQLMQSLWIAGQQGTEQDQREQAREQARGAYYQAFPDHNNPLILPILQTEAQKMAAEFPGLQWGADYINALGQRVNNAVTALRGGQPAPVAPAGGQQPAPRPAGFMPAGNRGGGGQGGAPNFGGAEQSELIEDTFSVFGGG